MVALAAGVQPGVYRVRVSMAACSAATCEFGLAVFGKWWSARVDCPI
jgi:hypothetical protein